MLCKFLNPSLNLPTWRMPPPGLSLHHRPAVVMHRFSGEPARQGPSGLSFRIRPGAGHPAIVSGARDRVGLQNPPLKRDHRRRADATMSCLPRKRQQVIEAVAQGGEYRSLQTLLKGRTHAGDPFVSLVRRPVWSNLTN